MVVKTQFEKKEMPKMISHCIWWTKRSIILTILRNMKQPTVREAVMAVYSAFVSVCFCKKYYLGSNLVNKEIYKKKHGLVQLHVLLIWYCGSDEISHFQRLLKRMFDIHQFFCVPKYMFFISNLNVFERPLYWINYVWDWWECRHVC